MQTSTWVELSQERSTESLVLWALHHLQQVGKVTSLFLLLKIQINCKLFRFQHSWSQSPCSWVLFPPATTGTALQKKVHVGRSKALLT